MWLSEIPAGLRAWLDGQVPFSFRYNGHDSKEWLGGTTVSATSTVIDAARERQAITYADAATGLAVTCDVVTYKDFPAAEWVLSFHNAGPASTPLIEDIRALDMTVGRPPGNAGFTLHAARGGLATPEDYAPLAFDLSAGKYNELSAAGGRSSNRHLPFFVLDAGMSGLAMAIGWSGEWRADFTVDGSGSLHVRADIATTYLRLHPGERIRTARILLIAWEGDRHVGHNTLRRLLYRHHTPLLSGEKPLPPTQCNSWFPVGDDGGKANAENQIALLEAYGPTGIEYLVMDAGWYGRTPDWVSNVGTWVPRIDTFPDGLKPVGEAAKRAGIQFGMWFEPERVRKGTDLDSQHPEWLLKLDGEERIDRLLNLGLPEVQQWFIDMVSRYIESVPLGYFRHDFNMDPLSYWAAADPPDRIGVTEIRYVEGLYRIWDALHARYPDLLMEGCASGGRRIDLESISRFHTYWKSDLYAHLLANQGHTYGASLYLPGNYLNTPLFDLATDHYARLSLETEYGSNATRNFAELADNPYAFRSQFGCALCLGYDPRQPGFDLGGAQDRVVEFIKRRHLFVGDFYPLTPYSLAQDVWMGYQFHRPDLDEGLVLFFRRHASREREIEYTLRGLRPESVYDVTFEDTGETLVMQGRELTGRQRLRIEDAPGSAALSYRRKAGGA